MPLSLDEKMKLLFGGTVPKPPKGASHLVDQPLYEAPVLDQPQRAEAASLTDPTVEPSPATEASSSSVTNVSQYSDEYLASFAVPKNKRPAVKGKDDSRDVNTSAPEKVKPSITEESKPGNEQQKDDALTDLTDYYVNLIPFSRYPYKYVDQTHSEQVADKFFNANKFWNRRWDIYYIWPPSKAAGKVLLLVPFWQADKLMQNINKAFESTLEISRDPESGLVLPFFNDGTPQPIYLGTSVSREDKDRLASQIPSPPPGHDKAPEDASPELDDAFEAYVEKFNLAADALKKKNKAARAKKTVDAATKRHNWCRSMRRTQCYLGLRGRADKKLIRQQDSTTDDLSWEEQKKRDREWEIKTGMYLPPLNLDEPAFFPFHHQTVMVSIDVESWERNHKLITEIGVSTLDTVEIEGVAPGEGGKNWFPMIRSRHFRIAERMHIVNKDFVHGCPDHFDFGTSEIISKDAIARVVDSCFYPPYSAGFVQDAADATSESTNTTAATYTSSKSPYPHRALLFVGHDTTNDINYLRDLGSTIFTESGGTDYAQKPSFLDVLDTVSLFRVLKRNSNGVSLSGIMSDLDMPAWNLHNAGNDARYTLQAMIGIALKDRLLSDGVKPGSPGYGLGLEKPEEDVLAFKKKKTDNEEWPIEAHTGNEQEKEKLERERLAQLSWDQTIDRMDNGDHDGGKPDALIDPIHETNSSALPSSSKADRNLAATLPIRPKQSDTNAETSKSKNKKKEKTPVNNEDDFSDPSLASIGDWDIEVKRPARKYYQW